MNEWTPSHPCSPFPRTSSLECRYKESYDSVQSESHICKRKLFDHQFQISLGKNKAPPSWIRRTVQRKGMTRGAYSRPHSSAFTSFSTPNFLLSWEHSSNTAILGPLHQLSPPPGSRQDQKVCLVHCLTLPKSLLKGHSLNKTHSDHPF